MVGQRRASTTAARLIGGKPCLEFANTAAGRDKGPPIETLTDYVRLLDWARAANAVEVQEARRLAEAAAGSPEAAAAAFERAVTLRETIYRVFAAVANDGRPDAEDMATLNRAIADALRRQRVVAAGAGFRWDWADEERSLDRPLWPVLRSAGELLTSDELRLLRQCASERCDWLFLDTSKNRSRRWCRMEICGNRAKAHRHQQRSRRGHRAPGAAV